MLSNLFKGIFDTSATVISVGNFLLCIGVAMVIGLMIAFFYLYKTKTTKSFFITLTVLPAVVCMVIMMVNGNVGIGVAVAGAFSLVRFRSVPGTAKEIAAIFLAMGAGLVVGVGYIAYAVLFSLILSGFMCLMTVVLAKTNIKSYCKEKTLKVTIPEDLNYTEVFCDILNKYTSNYQLIRVKTTNLGSLFKLTYNLTIKDELCEKQMIDEIRQRNGNLEVALMVQETSSEEL